jgi:hypothetical protein
MSDSEMSSGEEYDLFWRQIPPYAPDGESFLNSRTKRVASPIAYEEVSFLYPYILSSHKCGLKSL